MQNEQTVISPKSLPLTIRDLTVAYHRKPVIWDIDLTIPEGKLVSIVGPNGAGKTTLIKACLDLSVGQQLDIPQMRHQLTDAGYQSVESVFEHGEFAVRGSIIDIFPMGSAQPFRIDLFDDEIETLRTFDPESQRSDLRVEKIRLLPGKEYPLDATGITAFRGRFQELFDIDLRQCPLYQDVSEGISSPGLEYYLALFFGELNSLFDFLPENTIYCRIGDLQEAGRLFWDDINSRYQDRQIDRFRPILNPHQIFLKIDTVLSELKRYPQISFKDSSSSHDFYTARLPDLSSNIKLQRPFSAVQDFLQAHDDRVLFVAESAGRRETLLEVLKQIDIVPQVYEHWSQFLASDQSPGITIAPLDQGLWLPQEKLVLITEAQLFGNRIAQRRRRGKK
ncbi:MAG: ATP-binding cassette domain-containing protein, partial [Puniceicoccaceae bacterium]|nr:ATP-binding cassette domain-containing protein [Puniceicoccaceae bacterium]